MKPIRQESVSTRTSFATKKKARASNPAESLRSMKQHLHNVLRKERINTCISDEEGQEIASKNSVRSERIKNGLFRSKKLIWYWTTLATVFATMLATLIIHENAFPVVYIRWLLGLIYVVFLPGYSLVRSLQVQKRLNNLEFFCLSIGTSLALTSIFGLLLDQTPWGINLTTVTFGLLVITATFSTVAAIRDFKENT